MNAITKAMLPMILCTGVVLRAPASDATVLSVSGKVEMQQGGSWVAVRPGDTISKGTVISTGFKSSAELDIHSSTLTLGPLTRITVEQLASNSQKDEARLYLDSGTVNASVQHAENKKVDFKVSTPVATASVRGTAFTMKANGSLSTTEGLVSKGPAESSRAVIAENEEPSGFVPGDGDSIPTTPTSDVSATRGIPVFAGQTSRTDFLTGAPTSPQIEKQNQSQHLPGSTATMANRERQHDMLQQAGSPAQAEQRQPASGGKPANTSGSLAVTVTFADN